MDIKQPDHSPDAGMGGTVRPYEVAPIGWVESPLTEPAHAPRQGYLGAPQAWCSARRWPRASGICEVMCHAVAAGDSVVRDAAAAQWGGYFGYFSDPDGHLWKVASSSQ